MSNLLKKMFSIALCAALVGGVAAAMPAVAPDSGITANAADKITYGDYEYQVNEDETVCIVGYNGSASRLAIPSSINGKKVTGIGERAFEKCTSLTSVTIPDSVTSIGYEAFCNCTSLTTVTIPDSVTSIGEYAFFRCEKLTSITIPDSVTSIGECAFFRCEKLTSITIPDSVTSIGDWAFNNCESLKSVTIGNSVTSIGEYAFSGCTVLTSITIPDSVTSIGENAFEGCTRLTSVTIPDSVTSIGDSAFYNCTGLTNITIPDSVTSIGGGAFYNCTGLTNITIPDSVTSIGYEAFFNCESLTNVTIPDSVTSIGNSAFEDCQSLQRVTIPDSVTSIGGWAFSGTPFYNNQTGDFVMAGHILIGYKGESNKVTIPDSVTSIGGCAFYNCTGLTSVTIGNSVTSIGNSAFDGCTGLTSVTIPDSVTSIGGWAFEDCTSLTSVTIPDSVTSIGEWAFSGTPFYKNQTSDFVMAGHILIGYKGESNKVTIPDSVTSIGGGAFNGCSSLTSVTIPDSVTSIDEHAFEGCTSLKSVTIPKTVTYIGYKAFGYDGSNTQIEGFTIYGIKGSYAETYAEENGISFELSVLKNISTIETTATVGEPITLNAKAEGGEGDYTYALMYKKSTSDTWTKIGKKYGTASTGSFTPGKAVKYDVMINVKDATGKVKSKTFTVDVKAQLKNKTTINAETVNVGEKIVLKGAASGGAKGYKYAFYYKKSKNSTWTEMKPAYTTKSAAFKPGSATSYDVKSVVKDASGRKTEKVFTVKVTK